MATNAAALWLNTFFSGYDNAILSVLHSISCGILTFIFRLITFLGEKGIIFFLLALVCMCFSKTRKFGVCLFGAVACGALITSIILKDAIARPRPFESGELFKAWWNDIGAPQEEGFSFPSGHVTAAAAGMTVICLMKGKKWIVPSIGWVLLMMAARNYLMVHYPSDVLAGAIIGVISAFIAFAITKIIFRFLEKHKDNNICSFCLNFNFPDVGGVPSKMGLVGEQGKKDAYGYGYEGSTGDDIDKYSNGNMRIYAMREKENNGKEISCFAGHSIPAKQSEANADISSKREKKSGKNDYEEGNPAVRRSAGRPGSSGYVGRHEKH